MGVQKVRLPPSHSKPAKPDSVRWVAHLCLVQPGQRLGLALKARARASSRTRKKQLVCRNTARTNLPCCRPGLGLVSTRSVHTPSVGMGKHP